MAHLSYRQRAFNTRLYSWTEEGPVTVGTLIVDDQDDIRLLIRVLIEAEDHGLYVSGEAADGHEAVNLVRDLEPDVIVLDQMMPGIDGLQTADLIKQLRPNQVIILCSAYMDDKLREAALAAGITECMTKSSISEIGRRVRAVAARAS
jgi:CheY-like chemotaxis protein